MRTITLALIVPTQFAGSLCRGGFAQTAIGSSAVGCNKRPRIARNGLTTKAHGVQPLGLCSQVHFDIAQRFSSRQLRKRHGKKLIQTREVLDLVIASMRRHTTAQWAQRQIHHPLRKHELALVPGGPSRGDAKDRNSDARLSNRDHNKKPHCSNGSLTYRTLM